VAKNFFVAISHGSGVVLCKHDWQVTGDRFAQYVKEFFPSEKLIFFLFTEETIALL